MLKGSKQKHEVVWLSSRSEKPPSHVLNLRATSGHNVLYMRSDVSKELSRFRLLSSGRRRLLLKVPRKDPPPLPHCQQSMCGLKIWMWSVRRILCRVLTAWHLHQRINEQKYSAIGRHLKQRGLLNTDLVDKQFSALKKCRSKFV